MKKRQWRNQKCWDCRKAGGGCPWTALDEHDQVRFEPVPGWEAERIPWRRYNGQPDGFTYKIYDCPEFEAMPPRSKPPMKPKEISELCEACSECTRRLCRTGRAACRAVLRR